MDIGLILTIIVGIVFVIFFMGERDLDHEMYTDAWTARQSCGVIMCAYSAVMTVLHVLGLTAWWFPLDREALYVYILLLCIVLFVIFRIDRKPKAVLYCMECSEKLFEGDKSCHLCGGRGSTVRTPANKASSGFLSCVSCNQTLRPGDKFCHLCGALGMAASEK